MFEPSLMVTGVGVGCIRVDGVRAGRGVVGWGGVSRATAGWVKIGWVYMGRAGS